MSLICLIRNIQNLKTSLSRMCSTSMDSLTCSATVWGHRNQQTPLVNTSSSSDSYFWFQTLIKFNEVFQTTFSPFSTASEILSLRPPRYSILSINQKRTKIDCRAQGRNCVLFIFLIPYHRHSSYVYGTSNKFVEFVENCIF